MTGARRIGAQLSFVADHNFTEVILAGVRRRDKSVDILRVRQIGMQQTPDPEILEWAAQNGRVVLSHDVNTMESYAYDRIIAGLPMPGVFLVTEGQAFQPVIDDIVLAANSSIEGEWENRVVYLPFS